MNTLHMGVMILHMAEGVGKKTTTFFCNHGEIMRCYTQTFLGKMKNILLCAANLKNIGILTSNIL
jgi:hypothetical protein